MPATFSNQERKIRDFDSAFVLLDTLSPPTADREESRRYMDGTNRIDERAVLPEGEGNSLVTYYYLLQGLDTVAGLITSNGTLAEAYTYDAYGNVTMWGYRPGDFNRDGDVDGTDTDCIANATSRKPDETKCFLHL